MKSTVLKSWLLHTVLVQYVEQKALLSLSYGVLASGSVGARGGGESLGEHITVL